MKFLRIFIVLALFLPSPISALERPSLSLIYVCQGDAIYSAFGHVAFRYTDEERDIDALFSYGTFDFDSPGFVPKFVKGQLDYYLGITSFRRLFKFYAQEENRTIIEQRLNLTHEEVERITDYLINNSMPENRYYKYDFIKDNCASRIKRVFDEALDGSVVFGQKAICEIGNDTYREYLRNHLGGAPWFDFGIQLSLGMMLDGKVLPQDSFFLPEMTQNVLEESYFKDGRKLVLSTEVLHKSSAKPVPAPKVINPPFIVFSMLLAAEIALIFASKKKGRPIKMLSALECSAIIANFLFGVLLFYLCFLSDHTATKLNLNLMWCNPLAIVFLIANPIKRSWRILRALRILQAAMCVAYLAVMAAGLQHSASPFVPLILLYIAIFVRRSFLYNPKAAAAV